MFLHRSSTSWKIRSSLSVSYFSLLPLFLPHPSLSPLLALATHISLSVLVYFLHYSCSRSTSPWWIHHLWGHYTSVLRETILLAQSQLFSCLFIILLGVFVLPKRKVGKYFWPKKQDVPTMKLLP